MLWLLFLWRIVHAVPRLTSLHEACRWPAHNLETLAARWGPEAVSAFAHSLRHSTLRTGFSGVGAPETSATCWLAELVGTPGANPEESTRPRCCYGIELLEESRYEL